MKRSFRDLLKIMLMVGGLCLLFGVKAHAGVEEYEYPHYVGVATATVNVREGAGVSFDKVTDASGKDVQLSTGDEVEILEVRKADDGIDWYHIFFTQKGVEYIGFSTSTYVAMDSEKIITPAPTPTPVVEDIPEEIEPYEDSKQDGKVKADNEKKTSDKEDTAADEAEEEDDDEDGSMIWTVLWLTLLLSAVFFGFFVVLKYIQNKSQGQPSTPDKKFNKLKKINNQNKDAGKRVPQIRTTGPAKPVVPSEHRREVYVKRKENFQDNMVPASQVDIEQDNEEKRILREKIEQLQQHDLVRHVVYGEGEVYDNSDVKLLEVRFGNDMRFLKKDQLVNKRELVVFDEEDQSIARRRRRRINNQINRNY